MVSSPQALSPLRRFVRENARRMASGLGVIALVVFAGFCWINAFDVGAVKALCIVLSTLAIAFFAATGSGFWRRVWNAAWGSVAWWLVLASLGCFITLAKSGSFDEAGPIGVALAFGFYLGAPIAVCSIICAALLGYFLEDGR
jgi:hypothetical protein